VNEWIAKVTEALGLPPDAVDLRAVLDLTRDVARGVDRPAAPVTAYLLGLAVGRGTPAPEALTTVRGLLPPAEPAEQSPAE
jgi:hypothetical protein